MFRSFFASLCLKSHNNLETWKHLLIYFIPNMWEDLFKCLAIENRLKNFFVAQGESNHAIIIVSPFLFISCQGVENLISQHYGLIVDLTILTRVC